VVQRHSAALSAWEALEIRFERALEELSAATASGETDRKNRAFTTVQQVRREIDSQKRRVDEVAEEVRTVRSELLAIYGQRIEELYQEASAATDPQEQRELGAILGDMNNRSLELRAEEDPETTLDPLWDLPLDPRDTPENIRRKAQALDSKADQYAAQLGEIDRRLEELRQDQRRARQVRDFVSGVERYDDTRLPVVSPGGRTTTPPDPGRGSTGADTLGIQTRPLTLEERIQNLELTKEVLESRLQQIRDKAALYRRLAGGRGGQ
jgi:prefoldin subunit 5